MHTIRDFLKRGKMTKAGHYTINMKTIRQGVFETNSSSTHSLTIVRPKDEYNLSKDVPIVEYYQDKKGIQHYNCIVLTGGKFGWGPEDYRDSLTKLNYCAVHFMEGAPQYEGETNSGNYVGTDNKSVEYDRQLALFEKVVKEHTGADEIVYECSSNYGDDEGWSYIDHQSDGTASEAFKDEETLKAFLFNRQSVLVIDNDNH